MSHEATNWAFKQRGLKPAAKIVLLALADRHNPDHGCFPSKKTIAEDCEMSERAVYDQIKLLESMGLIFIEEAPKVVRGQFASNRYILGFEADFQKQNLPSAKSAVGKNTQLPSAKSADDRRQNLPTNPVNEPCNRTSKAAAAREASQQSDPTRRERLLEALGADPVSGIIGASGTILGTAADMQAADGWDEIGLSLDRQCMVLRERMAQIRAKQPNFVPRRFSYFTGAMQDAVAAKAAPRGSSSQQSDRDRRRAAWRKIAGRPAEGATA